MNETHEHELARPLFENAAPSEDELYLSCAVEGCHFVQDKDGDWIELGRPKMTKSEYEYEKHAQEQARTRMRKMSDPSWRAKQYSKTQAWRIANPEKSKAHAAVNRAIAKGVLIRPLECSRCSRSCKPEASHDDYSKALEVEWLCRKCHAAKDLRK